MAKPEGDEDDKATASDVLRMVSGRGLKTIIEARAQASEDRTEINNNVRAKITEVLGDKCFLDRMMLAPVEKLYSMEDDDDVAYHLDNLFYYIEASGLLKRAQKANPRLDLPDERKGKGAVNDTTGAGSNVQSIRAAAADK